MYKDKAVGNEVASGDGQRLSLYDHGTTERSFNAVERRGSTLNLNSLHGSRLRGTANLYDVLIRGEHWIVKKSTVLNAGAHVCLISEGLEG